MDIGNRLRELREAIGKTQRCATLHGDAETATQSKASIHAVLM
jgi:transcriptional regulator with XRE-family HTH domain